MKVPFYARVALILHAIALTLLFMWLGKSIFVPLFFAFLVSILMYPLVKWLERHKFSHALATVIALLTFLIAIAALVYFFSSQLASLSSDLPQLQAKLAVKLHDTQGWIARQFHINYSQQTAYVNKSANSIIATVANSLGTFLLGFGEILILFIFFVVFMYFMLYHRKLLARFTRSLFKKNSTDRVDGIITNIKEVINAYVKGLLIEMLILGAMIFVALLCFGVKYALLISIFAAVLNIIPYIGIYASAGLAMIITFANASGGQALAVGIIFLVAHFIDSNIVLPRVVGGRVKVNPFITILAVLIGHLLWGIPGMFLFIPLTAIIRLISEEVPGMEPWAILIGEEREEKKKGEK